MAFGGGDVCTYGRRTVVAGTEKDARKVGQ